MQKKKGRTLMTGKTVNQISLAVRQSDFSPLPFLMKDSFTKSLKSINKHGRKEGKNKTLNG